MKHSLILLLILALSVSCGTLKKRDNIVYADSSPRGLKVKDEKGNVHSDYYDLHSWSEFSVRVGYYFPEIKSITRKILPF